MEEGSEPQRVGLRPRELKKLSPLPLISLLPFRLNISILLSLIAAITGIYTTSEKKRIDIESEERKLNYNLRSKSTLVALPHRTELYGTCSDFHALKTQMVLFFSYVTLFWLAWLVD